jgi:hypothetical protein
MPSSVVAVSVAVAAASVAAMAVALAMWRPEGWGPCGVVPLGWYLDEMCRTGDVVFFESPGADALHRLVSPLTHVGLLVVSPTGRPTLVEMLDGRTVVHPGRGPPPAGMHVHDARARLGRFAGTLTVSRAVESTAAAFHWEDDVRRVVGDLRDAPYPRQPRLSLARCKLGLADGPRDGDGAAAMLCSEFVARAMVRLGVLGGEGAAGWRCTTPSDLLVVLRRSGRFRCPVRLAA